MRIITLEEHIITPDIVKTAPLPMMNAPAMQPINAKLLDVGEGRIADMDAAGISMQVLSVGPNAMDKIDSATANALARDANDRMAAAVGAHPDRFAAFGTLALQEPDKAAAELERCVRQLGFKGTMLTAPDGQFLDHLRFTPIFEAATALDVPIYLHPAPPPKPVMDAYYSDLPGSTGVMLSTSGWGWHVDTGMQSLRLIITGVFDRFPKLKIIIGHMGEAMPFSIARSEMVLSQKATGLKRPVGEYFCENFYLTTSGYFSTPPLLCMQQVIGMDRIMFSVDYPFAPNTIGRKFLDNVALSPEDMAKFTHRNAENLLKL